MPGLTAYVGLTRIAEMQEGDTVFVSGAAGAVGSLAGQMARLLGAVPGGRLRGLGREGRLADRRARLRRRVQLQGRPGRPPAARRTRPFDVYFDNVGGDHLEAAMFHLNDFGRIAACGAIAQYNEAEPVPGPAQHDDDREQALTLRGFIVSDHADVGGGVLRARRSLGRRGPSDRARPSSTG